jgi:D-alanyl-lipoteichoic acid acyltransferase DltB (MBOAT superfamily)
MLFPTTSFALFFAAVFTANWLLSRFPTRWRLFMIAASYFFYAWWDWRLVWLLAASTIISQSAALAVARSGGPRGRKLAMTAGVAGNLGLLCWFKYYGFFAVSLDNALHGVGLGSAMPLVQMTLPVGISFFTFMGISYVVDVYRGETKPAPWLDFAVHQSFFPHLIAGPIVRANELIPQIQRRRDPRSVDVARAAYLIWGGLFKKVVLSSFLAAAIVDPVFGAPSAHSSLEILVAVYAYAVQIYADFSGYTDIAIGVAMLLGFRLPQNFDAPYTARSLQEFWRRWHMTLSRWLRDYLYIPLGGSKGSTAMTYRNIMITMALGGLWHGAAWTFVAWGLLHGIGLVVGRRRQTRAEARVAAGATLPPARPALQRLGTFHFVCLGWLLFRSDSLQTAWTMLTRLFTAWGPAPAVTPLVLAAIALGIGVQYVPKDLPERVQVAFSRFGTMAQGAVLGALLFVITAMGPQGVAPFIYFRF